MSLVDNEEEKEGKHLQEQASAPLDLPRQQNHQSGRRTAAEAL